MGQQISGDVFELFFREMTELLWESGDSLGEQVIDHMVCFWVKLMKEQLDLVANLIFLILKEHADVNDLTFQLEHVIQDEVGYDHEWLAAHMALWVMQELENVLGLLVQDVGEPIEQVTHCNDDVGLDSKIDMWVKQGKK